MGLLLSLLKSTSHPSSPDLFEKELAELELKIERHQERLQAIKERERTTKVVVTSYSLLFWCSYDILWYMGWGWSYWKKSWITYRLGTPHSDVLTTFDQILELVPIVLVPIGLLFARRICQSWYSRKHESERRQLRQLQKQLREKVEDLKKKTSYYMTRDLLERYDDKTKPAINSSIRRPADPSPSMTTPNSLRQRLPPSSVSPTVTNPKLTPSTPLGSITAPSPNPAQHRSPNTAQSLVSPAGSIGRGWADRFAEALLGDDEAKPGSKYALICMKCSNHNGLVRQEELDTIQYVCPRCGAFNPAKTRRSSSPPHEDVHRRRSAHPTFGGNGRWIGPASTTTSLFNLDEDESQSEGDRMSTGRSMMKSSQSRKSLGVPSTQLSQKQQKRSTSSTVHNKPTRAVADELPALPSSRDSSSDSLSVQPDKPLPEPIE